MKVNTTITPLQSLIDSGYNSAITYAAYRLLMHQLHEKGKVTGPTQTQELLDYSRLNEQRMNRLDKHFAVREDLAKALQAVKKKYTWLVITEGWCGDAAQLLPMVEKMTFVNLNLSSKYILRDEHEDVMDMFLTNGKRSIPVVICLNDANEVIWTWTARPKEAQKVLEDAIRDGADSHQAKEALHTWYAHNKGEAFQTEMLKLVKKM